MTTAYNIICLLWGDKYSPEYVTNLYKMVKKNCTLPFTFYCITDKRQDFPKEIKQVMIEDRNLTGWWHKTNMFMYDWEDATNLFLDLDVLIKGNIDKFLTYKTDCSIVCPSDYYNPIIINSSVIRWDNRFNWHKLWRKFLTLKPMSDGRYRSLEGNKVYNGDQDLLNEFVNCRFPDDWTISYKMHKKDWEELSSPIVVFHGEPNPHQVKGRVKDLWRGVTP